MPVSRRYQIFVSSTYLDLKSERQAALREILGLNCIPAGMELFPAADADPLRFIKQVIDETDHYLLLVGSRHGSIHPDSGRSFTEAEYEYATAQKIPVSVLIHSEPGPEPDGRDKLLEAFRARLKARHTPGYWKSMIDLEREVSKTLREALRAPTRLGWIRATSVDVEPSTALEDTTTSDEQFKILKVLVLFRDEGQKTVDERTLATHAQLRPHELAYHVRPLLARKLVHDHLSAALPTAYSVTDSGIDLLLGRAQRKTP